MPSLINNGDITAANYRQQIVPFSRFGTRKIVWFKISHASLNNGGALDMTVMNDLMTVIQTKGEVVTVGAPYVNDTWGKFMVGLFEDTFNNGAETIGIDNPGSTGFNSKSETLQAALRDATGDSNLIVVEFYMSGAPEGDGLDHGGFSTDSAYREYDTKAEFLNGYTQN
jgi:hypothetical protein